MLLFRLPVCAHASSPATLARASARLASAPVPSQAPAAARGLATVTDAPKRSHGGLRDQDRIFQNAYLRHDHLLAGAKVRARGESAGSGEEVVAGLGQA